MRRRLGLTLVLAAAAAAAVTHTGAASPARPAGVARAQTTWAAPGRRPLPDARAAALVVHHREIRPGNARFNDYVPSAAQLRAFHHARDQYGVIGAGVPELRYVTGRPGLPHPSTDDLIQWVAFKWGIPTDWIRAQLVQESFWRQTDLGDEATVSPSWYRRYPPQARRAHDQVWESMGISQVKWTPDGSEDPGSEPLRWQSTAFALDVYAAMVRFFYDGRCGWCGPGYGPGQAWNSVGGWFEPTPWNNADQRGYIAQVKHDLATRPWTRPGF